tara:strand:- start:180 stop:695 length:516 start_codon:yes stop_codon:yes gene_type:complete
MTLTLNCLPEGEVLADLIRRNCATGFDLRFCRSVAVSPDDRDTITCDPPEAEFATLFAFTDLGEAIAIHDVALSSAGADDAAAVARALFVAIVDARRDPPDAAQRHQIEQDALTAAWEAEDLVACDAAVALLREIADLETDDDGDVILGADASGHNDLLSRITAFLATHNQ